MEDNLKLWHPLKGFEDYYEINKLGVIRSLDRIYKINGFFRRVSKSKEMKPYIGTSSYLMVQFSIKGEHYSNLLHRLIAIQFIQNPNNYPCVNHINGIKTDNRLENLEWCTYQYNNQHRFNIGYVTTSRKLSDEAVIDIYLNAKVGLKHTNNSNVEKFKEKYNIDRSGIHKIINGITYKNITSNIKR